MSYICIFDSEYLAVCIPQQNRKFLNDSSSNDRETSCQNIVNIAAVALVAKQQ